VNVEVGREYRLRSELSITALVAEIQGDTVVYCRYYQGRFVDVSTLNFIEFERVYELTETV
jgi:hypothetical protein